MQTPGISLSTLKQVGLRFPVGTPVRRLSASPPATIRACALPARHGWSYSHALPCPSVKGFPRLGTLPPKGHVLGFAVSGRATYFPVRHVEAYGFPPQAHYGQELQPKPQRECGLSTTSRLMLRILTDAWQPCQPLSGNYHVAARPHPGSPLGNLRLRTVSALGHLVNPSSRLPSCQWLRVCYLPC